MVRRGGGICEDSGRGDVGLEGGRDFGRPPLGRAGAQVGEERARPLGRPAARPRQGLRGHDFCPGGLVPNHIFIGP